MDDEDLFDDILGDSEDTPEEGAESSPEPPETLDAPVAQEGSRGDSTSSDEARQDISDILKNEDVYIPNLNVSTVPSDIQGILTQVNTVYNSMPNIDYDKVYAELEELTVHSSATPTPDLLNHELEKVQSSKDRVGELLLQVGRVATLKKRLVDILQSSLMKYAEGKSKDLREADVAIKMCNFSGDLATTEALCDSCNLVLKNLESLNHNLSRRITVFQLQLSLRDISRGATSSFEYDQDLLKQASRKAQEGTDIDDDFESGDSLTDESLLS